MDLTEKSKHMSLMDIEETIFKRRLVSDGDGRGDDKKIGNFMQDYVAWVTSNNPAAGDSEETRKEKKIENGIIHKRLMMQMDHTRFLTHKTIETIAVVKDVKEKYVALQAEIRVELGIHKQLLIEAKEQNIAEQRLKQCKMECEAMVKLLLRLPDRKNMEAKFNNLSRELSVLEGMKNELETKTEIQKQKLALLFQCSLDLAASLDEERPFMRENHSVPLITATKGIPNISKAEETPKKGKPSPSMSSIAIFQEPKPYMRDTIPPKDVFSKTTGGAHTRMTSPFIAKQMKWIKVHPANPAPSSNAPSTTVVQVVPSNDEPKKPELDPCGSKDVVENAFGAVGLPVFIEIDDDTPKKALVETAGAGKEDDFGLYEDIIELAPGSAESSFLSKSVDVEMTEYDMPATISYSGISVKDCFENTKVDLMESLMETYLVDDITQVGESNYATGRVTLHYDAVPIVSARDIIPETFVSQNTEEQTVMENVMSKITIDDKDISEIPIVVISESQERDLLSVDQDSATCSELPIELMEVNTSVPPTTPTTSQTTDNSDSDIADDEYSTRAATVLDEISSNSSEDD